MSRRIPHPELSGVYRYGKDRGNWRYGFRYEGKHYSSPGEYGTPEEAAEARAEHKAEVVARRNEAPTEAELELEAYEKRLADLEMSALPPQHPMEHVLRERGACREGHAGFFIGHKEPGGQRLRREAVAICQTCPERRLCQEVADLVEARATDDRFVVGVWGGELPAERIRRRKHDQRQLVAA